MATEQGSREVRCAVYTRTATVGDPSPDSSSVGAQREAAEAHIARRRSEEWVCLPGRYDDAGFSGMTVSRPALQRLLADVEAGKVDRVVVRDVARLSRSLPDLAAIIEVLDRCGTRLVAVAQQLDTADPEGRLALDDMLSSGLARKGNG